MSVSRNYRAAALSALLLTSAGCASQATERETFAGRPEMKAFVQEMAERHAMEPDALTSLLSQAQVRDDILRAISRPAEGKPWYEYRPIFLTRARIEGGVNFWTANADILAEVEQRYGVPPEIITAIIGVETRYGNNTGSYRVIDALSTLAFAYPPRAAFFRKELEQFLLLVNEEHIDPLEAKGSYAGAMGHGQFIPSSYRRYAVDFDGNGQRDLWNSNRDIIGSVANYFHVHGWEPGQPVATQVKVHGERYTLLLQQGLKPEKRVGELRQFGVELPASLDDQRLASLLEYDQPDGKEYWVGLNNFYVITRYNHSRLYAMAVYQLSQEILAARRQAGYTP